MEQWTKFDPPRRTKKQEEKEKEILDTLCAEFRAAAADQAAEVHVLDAVTGALERAYALRAGRNVRAV